MKLWVQATNLNPPEVCNLNPNFLYLTPPAEASGIKKLKIFLKIPIIELRAEVEGEEKEVRQKIVHPKPKPKK